MDIPTATIALVVTISVALLTAGALVARAVRGWAGEISSLRQEIAGLRLDMERQRSALTLAIRDEITVHTKDCANYRAVRYAAERTDP